MDKRIFNKEGKVPRKDANEATNNALEELGKAKKALADFDANFEKQWREVAEESRYAVTAVKGSKETTTKKGR